MAQVATTGQLTWPVKHVVHPAARLLHTQVAPLRLRQEPCLGDSIRNIGRQEYMSAGGTCTRPRAKQASRGLADASKPVWAPVRDKGSGMGAGSARCRHAWTGTTILLQGRTCTHAARPYTVGNSRSPMAACCWGCSCPPPKTGE